MSPPGPRARQRKGLAATFAVPAVLFALGLTGLVGALLVEGLGDLFFSVAAACGLLATCWVWLSGKRRG